MPLLWGTRAGATARLPGYTISGSTSPSVTDVDNWIEEAEQILTTELQALGAATTYASGSAAEARLAWLAETYAVGQFRRAFATAGSASDVDAGAQEFATFWDEVRSWRSSPTWAASTFGAGSASSSSQLAASDATNNPANYTASPPSFGRSEKW